MEVDKMCVTPLYVKQVKYVDNNGQIKTSNRFYSNKGQWLYDKMKSDCKENFKTFPCGKCPDCLIAYSKEWSVRIMNECSFWKHNCFITLTYANAPDLVNKRDLQLFLKRLRKKVGKVRYFACGEYGAKFKRPHYHAIIFNWLPEDLEYFFTDKSGNLIYKSKILSEIWQHGFVTVGMVTQDSAMYCAKYMQKVIDDGIHRPFVIMSLKPGIGFKFADNLSQYDFDLDNIYLNGKRYKIPRYYLKIAERKGYDLSTLKSNRELIASLIPEDLKDKKLKLYREKFNFTKILQKF